MYEADLSSVGFTHGEAKVYLVLCELKEGTQYKIAQEANISTSNIKEVLHRLIHKGAIASVKKNNVTYYYPINPHNLLEMVKQAREQLDDQEKKIQDLIPKLEGIIKQPQPKHQVEIYEGKKGILNVMNLLQKQFQAKTTFRAMGIIESKDKSYNQKWQEIHNHRAKMKTNAKLLFTEKNTSYEQKFKVLPLTHTKYVQGITPAAVVIYENQVFILDYGTHATCTLITNASIAASFTEFFESIWKLGI